jgi:hypothetical protein
MLRIAAEEQRRERRVEKKRATSILSVAGVEVPHDFLLPLFLL